MPQVSRKKCRKLNWWWAAAQGKGWREASTWPSMDSFEVTSIWMSDVRGIDFFFSLEKVLPVQCGKDCQQECHEGMWEATWHLNAVVMWSVTEYSRDPLLKEIVIRVMFWKQTGAIWQDSSVAFVLAYCCTHRWSRTVFWRQHSLLVLWAMLGGLWGPCRV